MYFKLGKVISVDAIVICYVMHGSNIPSTQNPIAL